MNKILPVLSVSLLLVVVGCMSPPYVYKPGEFNRSSVNYAQEPDDISSVTVCYARNGNSVLDVVKLATDRCGEFGKKAVYKSQGYFTCPLATPVAVVYTCVGESSKSTIYNGTSFQ